MIVKAGATVLATDGIGDDYQPMLVCRAVEDFDVTQLREEWVASLPGDERTWRFAFPEEFLAWLLDVRKVLVEVPSVELWIDVFAGSTDTRDNAKSWERRKEFEKP